MRRDACSGWTAAVLALAVLVAGCGGAGASAATGTGGNSGGPTPPNVVVVGTSDFAPAALTVPVNTAVTWDWNSCTGDAYNGQMCVSHGVVFDDTTIAGSAVQSSGSFSRAFAVPGVYTYHCAVHGTAMSGKITVQ